MDGKFEFKVLTNIYEDEIDIDGTKLPLLYPSMRESFNLLDFISMLSQLNVGNVSKTEKEIEQMTQEEYNSFLKENSKYLSEITEKIVPKMIEYFDWSVSKKLGRPITEQERLTIEILVVKNLDVISTRFLDFINKILPAGKGSDAPKKQEPLAFKKE